MIVIYNEGWHDAHGPITEDEAHTRLVASGLDVHDAYAELRRLRDIARMRTLIPHYIADASTRKWFVADERGIGRRVTRSMADLLLTWAGTPKRVRDRLFAAATAMPILLCDLSAI